MELFRKTRIKIACKVVDKKARNLHRRKKFNNLRNAHKIGIVWPGDMSDGFDAISSFHQEMQSTGVQVDILCYYPGKVLPDRFTALRYMNCFKRTDLNFFYIPRTPEVTEFINTPYDILIDINFKKYIPLYYVTALSTAEFRIGAGGTVNNNSLDMTIEVGEKYNISYYLEQVKYYLEMINTGI